MTKMNAKPLIAGIDKPVSPLALGTAFYKPEIKETCFELLDRYVELGGTLIDTARGYGTSEDVVGLWLEDRSAHDRVVLITKCGLTGPGALPAEGFPDVVRDELTTSLQILKTDCIDLYLLHRDNTMMTVAEILEPLNREIAHGRVCAIGASNWEYRRVSEANEYADKHGLKGFVAVSNTRSLAHPAVAFYPGLVHTDSAGERWHQETGIPLIPWSSQARGFFTGRYTSQMQADTEADALTRRMLTCYCTNENVERLERARTLGEQKGGYTAVEIALAWVLHRPLPIVPIVGPHTVEEVTSCVRALSASLTKSEIRWLNLE